MQTPVNDLLAAIFSWVVFYAVTQVPKHTDNYYTNLIFLTVIIPNAARAIVGDIPRLAVDRSFFAMTTLFALDRRKHLELNAVLAGAFIGGALITYFSGIDNSIYNNMMQA